MIIETGSSFVIEDDEEKVSIRIIGVPNSTNNLSLFEALELADALILVRNVANQTRLERETKRPLSGSE